MAVAIIGIDIVLLLPGADTDGDSDKCLSQRR
jgi:hypothetical protein